MKLVSKPSLPASLLKQANNKTEANSSQGAMQAASAARARCGTRPHRTSPTCCPLSQAVGRTCRSRPHVWVIPLAILGLMVGLGTWAVLEGASSYAKSERQVRCRAKLLGPSSRTSGSTEGMRRRSQAAVICKALSSVQHRRCKGFPASSSRAAQYRLCAPQTHSARAKVYSALRVLMPAGKRLRAPSLPHPQHSSCWYRTP